MLILILAVFEFVYLGAGLHIDATPGKIEIGVTRFLTVNCTTTEDSSSKMASLISIIISRSTGVSDINFTELDSINVFQSSGHVIENIHDNQTSTGVIDTNSQSYLSLVWEYPDATKAGLYKCEANGVDFAGHPVTINSTVLVSSGSPDLTILINQMRNMTTIIETLTVKTQNLEENRNVWNGRIESAKKWLFKSSIDYNNHRYLLSYPTTQIHIQNFQAMCELIGGYLVEIDSVAEFTFLREFLTGHKELYLVSTGASDEMQEGRWVNLHSGTVMNNIQWGTNEPNFGNIGNCMSFSQVNNYYMNDEPCHLKTGSFDIGFLCEIP